MVDVLWKYLIVFIVSVMPVVESKGAILLARLWSLSFIPSGALCAVGSFLPVPFLLNYKSDKALSLFKKPLPKSIQDFLEKYGSFALLVIISIPFTGVGCWLGALIARNTHMDKHKAAICIFIGNLIAIVLLTGLFHSIIVAVEMLLGIR